MAITPKTIFEFSLEEVRFPGKTVHGDCVESALSNESGYVLVEFVIKSVVWTSDHDDCWLPCFMNMSEFAFAQPLKFGFIVSARLMCEGKGFFDIL